MLYLAEWGSVADWFVAFGTLVLAAVAVFQDTIRGWLYRPKFHVSVKTEPPDCVSIPFIRADGTFVANCIYLRIFVQNTGKAIAQNAEVYAKRLVVKRADGSSEIVQSFPPMNLKWANSNGATYVRIAAGMGRHCDVGHIVDPACRGAVSEYVSRLGLNPQQTSLAFDLVALPSNQSHIIPPGEYSLHIQVCADGVRPTLKVVTISLQGTWDADESKMLRNGVGMRVF